MPLILGQRLDGHRNYSPFAKGSSRSFVDPTGLGIAKSFPRHRIA